jgi:hypothetical protein
MGLRETAYVVLPKEREMRKEGENWLGILRRRLVECPQCAQVWLVVGARENDHYVCKDCGHGFAISFLTAPTEVNEPASNVALSEPQ